VSEEYAGDLSGTNATLAILLGFAPTALRAPQHIFAIETILNITAKVPAEIFAALFRLVGAGVSLHSVRTLRP
jgi:hypothetical protein